MKRFVITALLVLVTGTGALAAEKKGDGWVSLFNGKSLAGWTQAGGHAKYSVQNGEIVGKCVPSTPNSFLCTDRYYTNFVLELEFNVEEGLNSGVQVRSHYYDAPKEYQWQGKTIKVAAGRVHGYQVEIDPAVKSTYSREPANLKANGEPVPKGTEPRSWTGGIYDEGRRGWLNDLTKNEAARKAFKPGDWNKLRIECNGDSIKTWLNDVPAADLKDGLTPSGVIALQVHGVGNKEVELAVRFKNIRVKEL